MFLKTWFIYEQELGIVFRCCFLGFFLKVLSFDFFFMIKNIFFKLNNYITIFKKKNLKDKYCKKILSFIYLF